MSASKIDSIASCPLRGFLEFVLRLPAPQNPYSAQGKALHYIFKRFLTRHPSTGRYPYLTVNALLGAWKGFYWRAVAGHHGFGGLHEPPETIAWQSDSQAGILFAQGVVILKKFFTLFDPVRHDGSIHIPERRFAFSWNGFTFVGVIDRLDLTPEGAVIVDYKRDWFSEERLASGVQLTLYQLAYDTVLRHTIGGGIPLAAMGLFNYNRLRFLDDDRLFDDAETCWQQAPLRSADDVGMLFASVSEIGEYLRGVLTGQPLALPSLKLFDVADVGRGDTTPRLPRSWHCKYCSYFPQCRLWEKDPTHPTSRELFWAKRRGICDERYLPLAPPSFWQKPFGVHRALASVLYECERNKPFVEQLSLSLEPVKRVPHARRRKPPVHEIPSSI
jgi:hypothetical protein